MMEMEWGYSAFYHHTMQHSKGPPNTAVLGSLSSGFHSHQTSGAAKANISTVIMMRRHS